MLKDFGLRKAFYCPCHYYASSSVDRFTSEACIIANTEDKKLLKIRASISLKLNDPSYEHCDFETNWYNEISNYQTDILGMILLTPIDSLYFSLADCELSGAKENNVDTYFNTTEIFLNIVEVYSQNLRFKATHLQWLYFFELKFLSLICNVLKSYTKLTTSLNCYH